MADFYLDAIWHETDKAMEFVVTNLTDKLLSNFRFFYGSLTRTADPSLCDGARFLRRQANYHEYAPYDNFVLKPGRQWRFTERNLTRDVVRSNEGPRHAGILLEDGTIVAAHCADLQRETPDEFTIRKNAKASILPWPADISIKAFCDKPVFHIGVHSDKVDELRVAAEVSALVPRLFPLTASPFLFAPLEHTHSLQLSSDPSLSADAYEIAFDERTVTLKYGPASGLLYGLVTLAQMMRGSQQDDDFAFPAEGYLNDAPRHGWRGSHLDVSRQIYPMRDVLRFVDMMAWQKLNRFHWHLSDDEGWRLQINAYPALTEIAAHNGSDFPILPQMGNDPHGQSGFYTQDEARAVVSHAAKLGVDVMPEIDVPGHCACVLAAMPELVDQDEPESYWSVQGYANNALNPGIEGTYQFIETVLNEVCDIFPFDVIHVGGDEVPENAWMRSPKAQVVMQREGLADTPALQSHFLRKVQEMLTKRGRITGGWEEVAQGQGLRPESALLFAWTLVEKTAELAKAGYDVVSTPAQAYYLDMAHNGDWHEPGASWAGVTSLEDSYNYEAQNDDLVLAKRLKGVHACIWSEYLTTHERFNHMVFPRLNAIAEAGWTPNEKKDVIRFRKSARFMPRM